MCVCVFLCVYEFVHMCAIVYINVFVYVYVSMCLCIYESVCVFNRGTQEGILFCNSKPKGV